MVLTDFKVSDSLLQTGVISAPDRLTGTAAENKAVFDRLIRSIVAQSLNPMIEHLAGPEGAGSIGSAEGNLAEISALAAEHIENKNNPHEVTVEQIGAETPEGAQAKTDAAMAAHANDTEAHRDVLTSIVEQAAQTFSNRTYIGTLLVTIPAGGWVPGGGNSERAYLCNVPAKVSADVMPEGSCVPGSFKTARKARVSSGCQCFDGYIQFYAGSPPAEDIQAWISLYRAWDGNTQVNGIPVGGGLELDENGVLVLDRNAVLSEKDFVDEDEMVEIIKNILENDDSGEALPSGGAGIRPEDINDFSEEEIADLFAD